MTASIAWLAFQGRATADLLEALGLQPSPEAPTAQPEGAVCGTLLPSGWYLLQLDDCYHPLVNEALLLRLSEQGAVLGCQVDEVLMDSAAFFYEGGQCVWSVTHESDDSVYQLSVEGQPPAQLAEIHARLKAEQDEAGGEEAELDALFDVPVELAEHLCAYRHDLAFEGQTFQPLQARA